MIKCTTERNVQILIQVLKANGVKRIIISPGTTNACFVASVQSDPFFKIYSAPEERSAAYMACGMAAESGEPVVLSCTGATASRNYMPALTEAYYRKLPVLAITSSQRNAYIGHNRHQVTDRTLIPNDVAQISVQMPIVFDDVSEWQNIIAANKAVLELMNMGGGPVHINLETTYSKDVTTDVAKVRIIKRYNYDDLLPDISNQYKIAIFVGNHMPMDDKLTNAIDEFCVSHNAVVLCDHTSNYKGAFRVFASIIFAQSQHISCLNEVDLLIHIGEVSSVDLTIKPKRVWRVNPDGLLKDTFFKLDSVFAMQEFTFFNHYAFKEHQNNSFYNECMSELKTIYERIPDFPYSSIWMASKTASKIPENSAIHFGIRNSLKTWNYFDVPNSVTEFSNTGGFGIDGPISTVVGAALENPDKLYFLVVGDLAFFYDINVFGNKHFPHNIRILLVNNAVGFEMHGECTLGHQIAKSFEVNDDYVAAEGHYGQWENDAVKSFAEEFGCNYYLATNKEEYLEKIEFFLETNHYDKSVVLETRVLSSNEDKSCDMLSRIIVDSTFEKKQAVRELIGDTSYEAIKKIYKIIKPRK